MITRFRPAPRRVLRTAVLAGMLSLVAAAPAGAITNMEGWLQDDPIITSNPASALAQLRSLGVSRVRLTIRWGNVAPSTTSATKPHFDDTNPAAYPAKGWAQYDAVVRDAAADGIALNFDIAGPEPVWASGPGHPKSGRGEVEWEPNDTDFKDFFEAVGRRYSGSFKPAGQSSPLPRVSFWTIWNEANYGPGLSPQGLPAKPTLEYAPTIYRGLVDAAWSGLHAVGHGNDTIVFGDITPRGVPNPQQPHATWGLFRFGIKPIDFVQKMYCLTPSYKPLRGQIAQLIGCPTTASQTARFASQNPALFSSSGFAIHPYSKYFSPNMEKPNDPQYASLADIGNLTRALDRSTGAYHSSKHFQIYNTEYGYITAPPKPHYDTNSSPPTYYVSPDTAADYINFAEYLSYKNPRIENYMQYLLVDPVSPTDPNFDHGGYASGLEFYGGTPKPTYNAYRMPLYLPSTTQSSGGSLEVWGDARPVHFAVKDVPNDPEAVVIQFAPGTSTTYTNLATVPLNNPYGYYDTRLTFPSTGTIRAVWQYPSNDLLFSPLESQFAISRTVNVTVH